MQILVSHPLPILIMSALKRKIEESLRVEPQKESSIPEGLEVSTLARNTVYAIPSFKHAFVYWQDYINEHFLKLKEASLQRCYLDCGYTSKTMSGSRSSETVNDVFMLSCKKICASELNEFYESSVQVIC